MDTETRQIVVDDTDLTIQYGGPWFLATGTHNNLKTGNSFRNTLHGVNVNANFSSTFKGSQLKVFGTVDAFGYLDPYWDCFVDGQSIAIGSLPLLTVPASNLELCGNSVMSDALHTLTVQVTVMNSSKTFWFDSFQYTPAVNDPSDNVTVVVTHPDSSIQYGPGWGPIGHRMVTQLPGTKVTLEFIGVQVTWLGILMNTTLAPASGTYSIDGDTPVSFPLVKPSSSLPDPAFNQIIFQTGPLPLEKHHLEVVYGGNTRSIPLVLESFIIQNATVTSSLPSSTSGNGSTDLPPNPTSKGKSKFQIGPVVVSVLGIVIIITVLLLLRHQRSRRRPKIEPYKTLDVNTPLLPTFQPFHVDTPERPPIITEKRLPSNRIYIQPITIQATGKVVRTDVIPEIASSASGPDEAIAPIQNGLLPVRTVRHQDSGLRLPEREGDLAGDLPPLYTAG